MSSLEKLRGWLEERPRKVVLLAECLEAMERLCPEVEFARRRAVLLTHLEDLQTADVLSFARSTAEWDRSGSPALPRRLTLKRSAPPRRSFADVAWVPALSFAVTVTRTETLEKLEAMNRFIIEQRGVLDLLIPYRERALQIFGDEKALNGIVRADQLWGRCPLSVIGAYNPEPPLAREDCAGAGGPLLLVENLHTYESLVRWNTRVRRYCSVAYGVGQAVLKAPEAVAQAVARSAATSVVYFGDLDREGIDIATGLAQRLRETAGLALQPERGLYELLLNVGIEREVPNEELLTESAARWLGGGLAARVRDLFERKVWMPQEGLSLDKLVAWSR